MHRTGYRNLLQTLSFTSATSYTNTFYFYTSLSLYIHKQSSIYIKSNKWFQCCVEIHTQRQVEVLMVEELFTISGPGKFRVCRKGVKACVISERGAMFKFPDDGYFNALDCLPCDPLVQEKECQIMEVWFCFKH